MTPGFVHLHLHSEYSLVDGLVRIPKLVSRVYELGMPAVAVTDHANLFCMVRFYQAALRAGVKPIVGIDLPIAPTDDRDVTGRLLLLCQDLDGYRRLARLVTRCYIDDQARANPVAFREWFGELTDGVIAISAGPDGDVGRSVRAGRADEARRRTEQWAELFPGRFYLGVQRTGREGEEQYLDSAVELAAEFELPVVATNDVRFLRRDDFEAHEARVCIHEGRVLADPRRPRTYSEEQYLRSAEEMIALFDDLPGAVENSVCIAQRCNLVLTLGENSLPDFPVPDGSPIEDWFVKQSRGGLAVRIEKLQTAGALAAPRDEYSERLEMELDVIRGMGYPGYFLIVADFIRWAREQAIPVGPGRGSGAGSLVAYALGITDLDPIRYELLFERFLNPERVSLPDFDIDFCMEGRDRVIDYVSQRYSSDHVAQIITFGTMAAKAVVRDVGRVMGHPYGFVDQLAKLIPFELGITLDRALDEAPLRERYDGDEEVRAIVDLALKLEGLSRNAGRHAGGVVIAPDALTQFTPLYREPGSGGAVTQFDKDDVEAIGLVKFDFLGLRTLTIIDWAVITINAQREEGGESPLDVALLGTEDPETYRLVQAGMTTAVFQLESRGMKELIRRLQPDCFDDLIALVALFRPGPLQSGMVEDFIDRKHGRSAVAYPHPELETILKPTYGVILYQEQVMQIAQVLAGYTLGGADLLRRAMGKKKPEEMAKQREVFVDGAVGRGVDGAVATYIFDLMEKFAGYGFNKSHSAAYALLSYQTAWLKAHYPAAFMAAVLSADMDNTDKVVIFVEECRSLGLKVLPPHVNHCQYRFTAEGVGAVRYGIGAIKGAGAAAIEGIIAQREAQGEFSDLFAFVRRIDTKRVNRRVIEALIRAGALDGLGPSRASMMDSLTKALQAAEQSARDINAGQNDMFGGVTAGASEDVQFVEAPEWTEEERLSGEKATLGLYLTGHPFTRFETELGCITTARLAHLRPSGGDSRLVAGLIASIRTMNSRKGRMAVITLDDRTARIEVVVYSDLFVRQRSLLTKDRLIVVEGEINDDEISGGCAVRANEIFDLESARERHARQILISFQQDAAGGEAMRRLRETLTAFRAGRTPICIDYRRDNARVRLPLGSDWAVRPADELLARLRELAGQESVEIEY